jgi:photosystem II stability/assembly factor-like uncharacterized protein
MTEDVLERLRRGNPVPGDPGAPPIELILARLQEQPDPTRPQRPGRARRRGGLVPLLGVLTTVAVVAIALALAGHRAPRLAPGSGPGTRGLAGVIFAGGSFAADGRGVISINQCHPCGGASPGAPQVEHDWTLSTPNGGRSWRTLPTAWGLGTSLFNAPTAHFSGTADAWAIGTHRVGQGPMLLDPFVSHDGGRTWHRAAIPTPGFMGALSVAGSTVWATSGGTCRGSDCAGAEVLRASTAGSSLTAVPTAAWDRRVGLSIAAGDAATAYVQVFAGHQTVRTLVTRDGGRSWQPLRAVCPTSAPDLILRAAGPASLWELCPVAGPTTVLERSDDGGRHWHRYRIPAHGGIANLIAVSRYDAWAVSDTGSVTRTADGGASWQTVWSAGNYHPRAHLPTLSPVTAARATITATQTAGGRTRVVVYRTHDGGASWQTSYVPLP